jgi:hypothetical protein
VWHPEGAEWQGWPSGEAAIALGAQGPFAGALRDATSAGLAIRFTAHRYLSESHGAFFGLGIQEMGRGLSGASFMLGYSFRDLLSPRWEWGFGVAPGLLQATYSVPGQALSQLEAELLLHQETFIDWIFASSSLPPAALLEHSVGVVFALEALPFSHIRGDAAQGASASLMVRYKITL